MTEPRMPSRTRLVRPACWRSGATGRLRPDVRDLYLGLATVADDEGWLLWQPDDIAITLYPYDGPARRARDFERRAVVLQEAGLLEPHDCGCAYLPRLVEDLKIKGGNQTSAVREFHVSHHNPDQYVPVHIDTSRTRVRDGVIYPLSGSGSSRASSGSIDPKERNEAIARALAALNDPNASDDIKNAARFSLDRLGVDPPKLGYEEG